MTKKTKRVAVDRGEVGRYSGAAAQFARAAEIAREFEYWNAAGLLYVHAAIAFADAVAIARKGEKSAGEKHMDALALFETATSGLKGRDEATEHLRRILDEKSRVSYMGMSFRRRDLEKLATHAERFRVFAERVLRA
jgi:hypothetical protein